MDQCPLTYVAQWYSCEVQRCQQVAQWLNPLGSKDGSRHPNGHPVRFIEMTVRSKQLNGRNRQVQKMEVDLLNGHPVRFKRFTQLYSENVHRNPQRTIAEENICAALSVCVCVAVCGWVCVCVCVCVQLCVCVCGCVCVCVCVLSVKTWAPT